MLCPFILGLRASLEVRHHLFDVSVSGLAPRPLDRALHAGLIAIPASVIVIAGGGDRPHLLEVPNRDSEAHIFGVLPDALGQHSVQVSQKNGSCGVDTLLGPAHALDAAVLLDGLKIRLCEAGVRVDGEVMLHLGDGIAFQLLRNGVDGLRAGAVEVALRLCGIGFLLGGHPRTNGSDL